MLYLYSSELESTILKNLCVSRCDKNGDGKISREEVKTVLEWSASANKLRSIKKQSGKLSSLIMEELDPDGNGFIEVLQKEYENFLFTYKFI